MAETVLERPAPLTQEVGAAASGRGAWRGPTAAFSLASLCYLRVWSELLHRTPRAEFYAEAPPQPVEYAAVLLNVAVLTAVFWALFRTAHRRPHGLRGAAARLALALSLLLPAMGLRGIWLRAGSLDSSPLSSGLVGGAAPTELKVLLLAGAATLLALFPRRGAALVEAGALLLAPFAVYAGAHAAWAGAMKPRPAEAQHPADPAYGGAGSSFGRVVWAIFDEWDAGLTFSHRPKGLKLEQFDRLRSEGIWAANAYPPGSATARSVSALLTGLPVQGVHPAGTDRVLIRVADSGAAVELSLLPNLFRQAQQQGWRSAAVGWHLPYCRLFGEDLAECCWTASATQANSLRGNLLGTALRQARSLLETERLSPFGQTLTIRRQAEDYQTLLRAARRVVAQGSIDLVYLHLPVPHGPFFYDRGTGRFDRRGSPPQGYLDHLQLADLSWGVLRRAIESAGLWESTTVLLSSDHAWRGARAGGFPADRRVPFLLKLAGQRQGVSYPRRMNTRCSQALLLEVLRGRLRDTGSTAGWMDRYCAEDTP